jgi:integrase
VRTYQLAALMSHLGDRRLDELGGQAVEGYKTARLDERGGVSAINNELHVLRTVLRFAKDMGHDVPPLRLRLLPVPGSEARVRAWSGAELQRLLAAASGQPAPLQAMIAFLANTGARKGEAAACEWSWFDFEASMLRIPATQYWQPKSGRPREVPLSDALGDLVRGPRRHERWVFPCRHGDGELGRYVEFPERAFAEARQAAGLRGGPHTLRHTFASHFLAAPGTDLFLLAQVMGHSQLRVTELYSHMLPGHLARARNAVNVALPGKTVAATMAKARKVAK